MNRVLGLLFFALFAAVAWSWLAVERAGAELAQEHLQHRVSHPGWTFPVRIWSAPVPLSAPTGVLAANAQVRGYEPMCPPEEPGQYCPETDDVLPRGGLFSEGPQPPGLMGWSRQVALEPVRIGTLVGADGELREHLPLALVPEHMKAVFRALRTFEGMPPMSERVVDTLLGPGEASSRLKRLVLGNAALRTLRDRGVTQVFVDGPCFDRFKVKGYPPGTKRICGIQAAARGHWGVEPWNLSLAESASIVAFLVHPERPRAFADRLLDKLSPERWDLATARRELVAAHGGYSPGLYTEHEVYAPFVAAVRSWLEGRLEPGQYAQGIDVFTSLDVLAQQRSASLLGASPDTVAAAVVDTESGMLVAAVGAPWTQAADHLETSNPSPLPSALVSRRPSPVSTAAALATLVRGGLRGSADTVSSMVDAGGRLLHLHEPSDSQVVRPSLAWRYLRGLRWPMVETQGFGMRLMGTIGGIRGESSRWYVGASPYRATSLVVRTPEEEGGPDLERLWAVWMRSMHEGLAPMGFARPSMGFETEGTSLIGLQV
ncbi:MAG: hypothetical protein QGG40_18310, partial [Myxococcota bacterium]|nr:hypothetical protein [Myxococcota bacterium]